MYPVGEHDTEIKALFEAISQPLNNNTTDPN